MMMDALVVPPSSAASIPPGTRSKQLLKYDVHDVSTFSINFPPANVLSDKPADQASRWSSSINDQNQFIMLKLERPAVVQSILFGKHHKQPNSMFEVLYGGLRNDTEPESFPIKYRSSAGLMIPVEYIKVVPISTFGKDFQYSIWYIELQGIGEPAAVEVITQQFTQWREVETVRLCLKHFRQRNYLSTFMALSDATQLRLEDKLLTELHQSLVVNGNFSTAEQIMSEFAMQGMFSEYIENSPYRPVWNRLYAFDEHGQSPCMRGGHQLCIDSDAGRIYLFGGWNGNQDLADLWVYEMEHNMWTCLSPDTRNEGGPSPRSCHKMAFDRGTKIMYCFGRYVDSENRQAELVESDFWQYDTITRQWLMISHNTQTEGGPALVYDHQMCIDNHRQIIYIFGGRAVTHDNNNHLYSGLYAYHIRDTRWEVLRQDSNHQDKITLRSRSGHSMVFNSKANQLYILCGQRVKEHLSDFTIYDIDSNTVTSVVTSQNGPEAGCTQRCVFDSDLGELYVLSSLTREHKPGTSTDVSSTKNVLWVYKQKQDTWERIHSPSLSSSSSSSSSSNIITDDVHSTREFNNEPIPRYAHHLVYDEIRKRAYMFGGNPDNRDMPNQRLDDFWELSLLRLTPNDVRRKCLFEIRRQWFIQMCAADPITALRYLQVEVGEMVDHRSPEETQAFKALTSHLFQATRSLVTNVNTTTISISTANTKTTVDAAAYKARTELYERLLEVFPTSMKQPKGNLLDTIPYV